ncbi:MAG: tetratricopeptide repeat protein [Synechococcales cyanobacterium C42_A2020_086]|jgi:tetratricopeptide (TPR) repeat protein|nr:tetratricopeptide repeat protein [Synechococcales cyanobacterium C42_A2020_086]
MRLSLCMIVRNEAANLPRCLESVQGVVDEIVLLDTGSTDSTLAIAEAFGAKIAHFPWNQDFAEARNVALEQVTGDWVLVLDADEALAAGVIPIVQQAMQQDNVLVINLIRQEIGAAQSPYSLVSRLFRRHSQIRFSRPYHALIDDSVAEILQQEPHWQIVNCPEVAILHYGYEPGTIASRDKLQRAKAAMEQFWTAHPDDPYVCSKLGALYVQMDDWQRGIELLERGLATAEAPVLYELHYHLGIAYSRLSEFERAEQHYRAAIAQPILECLKLGAYNNLGNLLKTRGDLNAALATYQTCIRLDAAFAQGHYNLGLTLKSMGQLEAAITHYQTAIQLNPRYAEAYQNLGVAWLKLGRVPESLDAFRQAIALHQEDQPAEAERLRQGLQSMGLPV